MTTEYSLEPGDTHESLARDLLEQAENPDQVHWSPRPDVHGGGVYILADGGIAERVRQARQARRDEEAARTADSLAAAEARDADPDVASGLATPAEAGFAANAGTDPGSAGEAERIAELQAAGEADDEAELDDEEADEDEADEKPLTPAQKRAAAKKAKQDAAAKAEADEAADDEEKSE